MIDHLTNSKRKDGNMLRYYLGIVLVLLAGCGSSEQGVITSTHTVKPTTTITMQPTLTATLSTATTIPVPSGGTLILNSLGLVVGDIIPTNLEVITEENISELVEIARWGKGALSDISYSEDGNWFAVGTSLGVYVYDAEDLEKAPIFISSNSHVLQVAISPSGAMVALGLNNGTIEVWHINRGELLYTHSGSVDSGANQLDFSPDGKYLAANIDLNANHNSGIPLEVSVWNAQNGDLVRHYTRVLGFKFSKDGNLIALNEFPFKDGDTVIWNIQENKEIYRGVGGISSIAFSPSGNEVALGNIYEGTIEIWDLVTNSMVHRLNPIDSWDEERQFPCTGFWPGGPMGPPFNAPPPINIEYPTENQINVVYGPFRSGKSNYRIYSLDDLSVMTNLFIDTGRIEFSFQSGKIINSHPRANGNINFLDVIDLKENGSIGGFYQAILNIELSPDARLLGIQHEDILRFLSTEDGRELSTFDAVQWKFSPMGTYIALGYEDGLIELRSPEDFSLIWKINGHAGIIENLTFTQDEQILVSSGDDCGVRVWGVANGDLILEAQKYEQNESNYRLDIGGIRISSNGKWFASGVRAYGRDAAAIWETSSGKLLHVIEKSEQGELIFFNNNDLQFGNTIFDVRSGEAIRAAPSLPIEFWVGAYSPDGGLIVYQGDRYFVEIRTSKDGDLLQRFSAHISRIEYYGGVQSIIFAPNGRYFATGGVDGTVRLWGVLGD